MNHWGYWSASGSSYDPSRGCGCKVRVLRSAEENSSRSFQQKRREAVKLQKAHVRGKIQAPALAQ